MFICNNGHRHTHETVVQSKICHGLMPRPRPRPVITEWPTVKQINFVRDLGGDVAAARRMSRSECSAYITSLKAANQKGTSMSAPAPTVQVVSLIPAEIFANVPDGYYAWQPDSETPLKFLRIKTRKTGRWAGSKVVQTQHGPNLSEPKFAMRNDGSIWVSNFHKAEIEEILLGVVIDYKRCGRRYSLELGRCQICNLELTDERSRHYGIGPDCEKRHGYIIEEVDDELGYAYHS